MPKKLIAALNYNEHKVKQGKAACIYAAGYLRDASDMNFYQKLEGFERLNVLNERATTKTIHVSLNFDPSENFNSDKLIAIASAYIQKIGFAEQPYLIYQHFDAGHPHVHLVSTTIREDGSRIHTHNIGKNLSEKARKELEEKFGLVKAEGHKRLVNQKIQAPGAEKLVYGKAETKKGISNVINAVMSSYKYCSLPEFNAILKQFNVLADRGSEAGRIFKNRGLVFRVLDAEGNKVGVPVKASDINTRPTLDKLEKKFLLNQSFKDAFKNNLKAKVDEALAQKPPSLIKLIENLQSKNVYTVIRKNSEGRVYGITFVDNDTKTVFNGSELGKMYSVASLLSQILSNNNSEQLPAAAPTSTHTIQFYVPVPKTKAEEMHHNKTFEVIDALLSVEKQFEGTPFQLLRKKRKRKRRSPGL
ncbi:MAG: relaxase/mobilization nuclease domain-containing protein [Flavisolibacter sp.]